MDREKGTLLAAGVALGAGAMLLFSRLTAPAKPPLPTSVKVTYFDIPALAEPIRLVLQLGKANWTDTRLSFAEWPAIKPTTKWGQVPVIKLSDGSEMTQTKAILRYFGKLVSVEGKPLYPCCPWAAFLVDEMIEAFEDVRMKLVPTFAIKDAAEKEAARAALFAADGACTQLLTKIEAFVGKDFIVADTFTLADVWAYFILNFLRCGFWDGLPTDYLSRYPKLSKVVANVGAMPAVKAYYTPIAAKDPKYKCFLN